MSELSWEKHRLAGLPNYFLENLPRPCFGCAYAHLWGDQEATGEDGCEVSIGLGVVYPLPIPDDFFPVVTRAEIVPQTGQLSLFQKQLRLFKLKEFFPTCSGWSCSHDVICIEIGELSDPVSEGGEEEGVRRFLRNLDRTWCQHYEPSKYLSVIRGVISVGDKVRVHDGWHRKAVVLRRIDDSDTFLVQYLGASGKFSGPVSRHHSSHLTVINP